MKIECNQVIPIPMLHEFSNEGTLWGKNVCFESGKNQLVDARSGKGKSTLTSFLSGIRYDYTGEIFFDQRNINTFSKNEWTKVRATKLAFVFQDLQLFDTLSVKENLLLKNNLTYFNKQSEIKKMLGILGLDSKWDVECAKLSLGQQQRVAILRALLQPASYLIMDEPFSHLDKDNTEIAIDLIQKHCSQYNIGIILTSLGEQYSFAWDKIIQIA